MADNDQGLGSPQLGAGVQFRRTERRAHQQQRPAVVWHGHTLQQLQALAEYEEAAERAFSQLRRGGHHDAAD